MITLTTLAHVRRLLGKELVGADFDDDITNRIIDVSYRIQALYSVDLELQTYVEIKDGGGVRIYPDNFPVVSVTSVIVSNDLSFATGETIPTTEYAIVNRSSDVAHINCWPAGQNGVQLTYIGGYLDADTSGTLLPRSIQEAVGRQVAYEFNNRKSIGLTSVDFPDGSIQKETDGILKSVRVVLDGTIRKTKIG
jgi:hypothetical protein